MILAKCDQKISDVCFLSYVLKRSTRFETARGASNEVK